jgi:adenine-specific DNA-methyltransferase
MSRLTDLIQKAKQKDPQLGTDLEREFRVLSERVPFGLNFERHKPEAVELPQRPVRRGDKVRVLPPRGATKRADKRLWRVSRIERAGEVRLAQLSLFEGDGSMTVDAADCVVVAEFRDPIFPGLVSTGKVERGNDKPFHTIINGENFHVLEALTYTHKGKVDCIYIDPPYNSGAKDWKYNNDYVEGDDLYRHSKWLAFMERRLRVAQQLLNPNDSVLIVTIDEKELHRLALLLEQTFPEATVQVVTIVITPSGQTRGQELDRVNEHALFVFLGAAQPHPWKDDLLNDRSGADPTQVRWESLLRSGTNSRRENRPGLFYPIFINAETRLIVEIGDAKPVTAELDEWSRPEGTVAIWPIKADGSQATWQASPNYLKVLLEQGFVKVGTYDPRSGRCAMWYLGKGRQQQIASGHIVIVGRDEQGAVVVAPASEGSHRSLTAKTVWNRPAHHAGWHGSALVRTLLPRRAFPFPKSLYAVEDALRIAVGGKPDAVVLDFFAGSGTTAHALMRLNKQDGGQRKCILATNNEVSADEQAALHKQGLRPGDAEWERYGICDYITKPRVLAAITGLTPDGEPIKGDYKFTDEFPINDGFNESAEFFTLTYETPLTVRHNAAFERIAPMLWMRAGSVGERVDGIPETGWRVVEAYGILFDLDTATPFCRAVRNAKSLKIAYVVTDDARRFQSIVRRLPSHVEPVRLYESYLTNFEINMSE